MIFETALLIERASPISIRSNGKADSHFLNKLRRLTFCMIGTRYAGFPHEIVNIVIVCCCSDLPCLYCGVVTRFVLFSLTAKISRWTSWWLLLWRQPLLCLTWGRSIPLRALLLSQKRWEDCEDCVRALVFIKKISLAGFFFFCSKAKNASSWWASKLREKIKCDI